MEYLKLLLPIGFLMATFGFERLWAKSRKPVYNNPVIFNDGGNQYLCIASFVCMIGFAVSLFMIDQ